MALCTRALTASANNMAGTNGNRPIVLSMPTTGAALITNHDCATVAAKAAMGVEVISNAIMAMAIIMTTAKPLGHNATGKNLRNRLRHVGSGASTSTVAVGVAVRLMRPPGLEVASAD